MQTFTPGQANTVHRDVVNKSTGAPITTGTVTVYLIALSGANAGKWFQTSDDSWSATEAAAGTATHKANGHWTASIDAAAWTAGVRYELYAKESGSLDIPYSEEVACKTGYKLASDGLDSVSITGPSGVAANFREMLVQLWRRFFKKTTLTSSQMRTYADDGSTVVTTQAVEDDDSSQTIGSSE